MYLKNFVFSGISVTFVHSKQNMKMQNIQQWWWRSRDSVVRAALFM